MAHARRSGQNRDRPLYDLERGWNIFSPSRKRTAPRSVGRVGSRSPPSAAPGSAVRQDP